MFIRVKAFLLMRMNAPNKHKGKRSLTDIIIEKSVELYGFTPDEKSDENLKWMFEKGYNVKQVKRRGRSS